MVLNLDLALPFALAVQLNSRWARAIGAAPLSRVHFGFVCGFLAICSSDKFSHESPVSIMDTFPSTDSSPVVIQEPFQQRICNHINSNMAATTEALQISWFVLAFYAIPLLYIFSFS
jgi:hypothetical protein